MSKSRSQFASKNYPGLYKYPKRGPHWVFRKYSAEKHKEFMFSTGETSNEAKAYKLGLEAFNEWLGRTVVQDEMPLLGDYARRILNVKLKRPDQTFSQNSKRASTRDYQYLIETFGGVRVDQMTEKRWEDHYTEALAIKTQTFFNRRKALIEIMIRAVKDGLIDTLPEYINPDSEPQEGEYLEDEWVKRILAEAHSDDQKVFYDILWRQGPRPGETLQYEWSMIRWKEGDFGFIHIPAAITKTRRSRAIPLNPVVSQRLKERQAQAESKYIFPGRHDSNTHQAEYKTGWNGACRRAADRINTEIEDLSTEKGASAAHVANLIEGRDKILNSSIYALRGTFITNCLDQGFSSTFIGKYCDTSSKMIDSRYARRKKSAMQSIANVGGGV